MNNLFGERRIELLHKYKKEILIRFLIATGIYAFGVALVFIFKKREAMYLLPIILGFYSMLYIGYDFYFILMYVGNYRGNKTLIKRVAENRSEFKYYEAKVISTDSIIYRMYGVYCHNILFLNMENKQEFSLFVPMENLGEFEKNKIYKLEAYLSVIAGYEEKK